MATKKTSIIPVVITTTHRGVFFGHAKADELDGTTVRIERARNCLYWHQSVGGVLGLAEHGPNTQCRIGARVPALRLRDITAVMECSPEAAQRWEDASCVS